MDTIRTVATERHFWTAELNLRDYGRVLLVGDQAFEARLKRGRLVLLPDLPPARWVDRLLRALSAEAAADAGLRSDLSRAGWQLR